MSSSGGGGSSTTTQVNQLDPTVAPFARSILQRGQSLGLSPASTYSPGFNPNQRAGLDQIAGAAGAPMVTPAAATYAAGELGRTPEETMNLAMQVARPQFEQIIPGVQGAFALAGRENSGLANEALGRGLGTAFMGAYNTLANRQANLAAGAGGIEQARYTPGQALMQVGDVEEARQRLITEDPWRRLQMEAGLAFGNPLMGTGTTTGRQPTFGPSPLSQAIGGIGAAGTLMTGLAAFSDENLKEIHGRLDPQALLRGFKAIQGYSWSYRGEKTAHKGPVAQDYARYLGVGNGQMVPLLDAVGTLTVAVGELARRLDRMEIRYGHH